MQLDLFEETEIVKPAGGIFTMRPYQADSVDAVFWEWETHGSTMVVLPTGCGKTVVFAEVCNRFPVDAGRILIAAHRTELIQQACEKVGRHLSEEPEVEMAELRAGMRGWQSSRVVVTSIQTQNAGPQCRACQSLERRGCDECMGGRVRRMMRFNPYDFGLVIIDEAHHAAAKSYRRVIGHFAQNPNLKVLLVTATPNRTDNIGLHNVCDSVAYQMSINDAINGGWLVPIRQQYVVVKNLDFSKCRTKKGGRDLADGDVERAVLGIAENDDAIEEEAPIHELVAATHKASEGKPTLIFAAGKKAAEVTATIANRYDDVRAEFVIDSTPKDERKRIIDWFKGTTHRDNEGYQAMLVGCGVFTEGFDADNLQVIAVGRPTASESLYTQIIGRGTRSLAGTVDGPDLDTPEKRIASIAASEKPHCLILDFVGNSGRHKLVSTADILAGDELPEDIDMAISLASESGEDVDIQEAIEAAKQKRLDAEAARLAREEEERLKREEEVKRKGIRANVDAEYHDVDPFGYDANPNRVQTRKGGATQKQVDWLVTLGVERRTAEGYGKRQAGQVIDRLQSATGRDYRMRFGKHKGQKLKDVPKGYLKWAVNQDWIKSDFREAAHETLRGGDVRQPSDSPEKPMENIDAEFRSIVAGEKVPF